MAIIKYLITAALLSASPAMADPQAEIQRSMDRARAIAASDRYHNSNACNAKDYAGRTLDSYTLAKTRGVQGLDGAIARVASDIAYWSTLCEKDLAR
jgi:hypothetical protein